MPRVEVWGAAGDADDGSGIITYHRLPVHWWLLDRWLDHGHPHWGWWNRLWSRVLPYWGDPFCAAYTVKWAPLVATHEEDPATIEVGWAGLPSPVRSRIPTTTRFVLRPGR